MAQVAGLSAYFHNMLLIEQLECIRGDKRLFTGLDFGVSAGEVLRITGSNGAGKTSLLRLLAALSSPHHGKIYWHGQPVQRLGGAFRAQLRFLGHQNAIKEELTPLENLLATAQLAGNPVNEAAAELALAHAGVSVCADLACKYLSQGQKRRTALASLCHDQRPLWILDEPFVALDTTAIAWLSGLIGDHARDGGLAVLTSHQPVELDGVPIKDLHLDELGKRGGAC